MADKIMSEASVWVPWVENFSRLQGLRGPVAAPHNSEGGDGDGGVSAVGLLTTRAAALTSCVPIAGLPPAIFVEQLAEGENNDRCKLGGAGCVVTAMVATPGNTGPDMTAKCGDTSKEPPNEHPLDLAHHIRSMHP